MSRWASSCICKNQKETSLLHRMRLLTIKMINQIKLIIIGRFLNLFIYLLCWKKIWEIVPEEIITCSMLQNMEITSEYSSPLLTKMLWCLHTLTWSTAWLSIWVDYELQVVSCILFFLLISSVLLEWLAKE